MERRRFQRKSVDLKAERISGDATSAVFIENLSERGIRMIIAPSDPAMTFLQGTEIRLKLRLSPEEKLDIKCRVIWSYIRVTPEGSTNSIGMEVLDPPLKYREFVKNLH
jgi:hypothetical protein